MSSFKIRSFLGDPTTNLLSDLVKEWPAIKNTLVASLQLDPSAANVAKVNSMIAKFDPAVGFLKNLDFT